MSRLPEVMWRVLEESLLVFARVVMERLGRWLMDKLHKPIEAAPGDEARGGEVKEGGDGEVPHG